MFDIYLASIQNAILHRRAAVNIEIAVGICVAYDFRDNPTEARVMLTNVYASAGYDCLVTDGVDYKTVNRRVNASLLLFEKVGADPVGKAIATLTGHRRIEAAQELLAPLNLQTMNDVLGYCGRPVARSAPAPVAVVAHTRREADHPGTRHVRTAHIDVPIPTTATRAEVLDLVAQLLKLAETLNNEKRRPVATK